jgi:hypothetical protein
MPIRAYGIKWSREEVDWDPGEGGSLVMLGRHGESYMNARDQKGFYVLYSGDDLLYVAVTRTGLGERLADHTQQSRLRHFDRFSWFGFRPVMGPMLPDGTRRLRDVPSLTLGDSKTAIADVQSLLIRLLHPAENRRFDPFRQADEWLQVKRGDPLPGD